MCLGPRRRLALVGQFPDDFLGDRPLSPLVLGQDHGQRRFNIHDLDASPIVGKQVEPPLPSLAQKIRGTEGKGLTGAEKFPASLSGQLDHLALILHCFNVQFVSNVVQRYHGEAGAVLFGETGGTSLKSHLRTWLVTAMSRSSSMRSR